MSGELGYSQPERQSDGYHVTLPCGLHEVVLADPVSDRAASAVCSCGRRYTVIPVSNEVLDIINSFGPRSPSGLTVLVTDEVQL
jgi:hypothetical protein